ncbi:ABC transporter permease [Paenibacillus pasadenensis]|uniref:ABC transporter permease n=1 Tax=Paenibacillus pasadenensis TaxID=217090 RepID=UPI00203B5EF0|nr:ABC transporter permease [Paenibacillus pasadenensis]MCM3747477.1 ABC transporter permease [Paenibacillus pasadenensis]
MNFVKRAFLSVKMRKVKSLLLMGIFFIVLNLVLAGLAIQSASKEAAVVARQTLGADVILKIDLNKYLEAGGAGSKGDGTPGRVPSVDKKDADKLIGSAYIKSYNYVRQSAVEMLNLDWVKAFGGSESFGQNGELNFTIFGVMESSLVESFQDGKAKMVEGEPITKDMADRNVAVIEKRLAAKNKLKVGDKIKVASMMEGEMKNKELEIIGIYESKKEPASFGGATLSLLDPANEIYVPFGLLQTSSPPTYTYYLKDPKDVDAFKKEALSIGNFPSYYQLDANDDLYKQMMKPIESMASIAKLMVTLVVAAGIAILALIIMLSIKERRKEMGILLSIGEKKSKLIGQFVVEVLLVAVIALGLSSLTGEIISQKIGDTLLANEIASTENNLAEQQFYSGAEVGEAPQINEIDISVTPDILALIALLMMVISLSATLIPALSIMRLNPKDILLKDE